MWRFRRLDKKELTRGCGLPVSGRLIACAERNHVLAYLVKPIKAQDLEPAIAMVMSRFEEFQNLQKETTDLRRALEDRKTIEQAKAILMKQARLDEPAGDYYGGGGV